MNDEASAAEIASAEQTERLPDIEDFWTTRSLEELAEVQGVEVVESIEMLQDGTVSPTRLPTGELLTRASRRCSAWP